MSDNQTVGSRLRLVRKMLHLSQQEMAEKLGLSTRGWQKIERDEGLPNSETLLRFNRLGINPGWVLSGIGPQRVPSEPLHTAINQSPPIMIHGEREIYDYMYATRVDPEIFSRVWEVAKRVHDEAGIKLPKHLEVKLAAIYYNQLLSERVDILNQAEIGVWLEDLKLQLQAEMREAKDEPGTGKPSASSS